jgi:mevalonate kinase
MKKIIFSAPGSVILSGEYGINFGKPALILAISLRTKAIVTAAKKSVIQAPHIVKATETVQNYLRANSIPYKNRPFNIVIQSEIPKSEVFGYLSALYAVLVASLYAFYSGHSPSQETVGSLAYQLEKELHKKTYGIRTSASSFGGLIYFRKEFEFLRTISLLKIKVPESIEKYIAINANEIENTIGKGYNIDARETERLLSELEKTTKRMVVSFITEDLSLYKDSVRREEELLYKLCQKNMHIKTQAVSLAQDVKGVVSVQI